MLEKIQLTFIVFFVTATLVAVSYERENVPDWVALAIGSCLSVSVAGALALTLWRI